MKKLIIFVLAIFIGISAANAAPAIDINGKLAQLTSNGMSITNAVTKLIEANPSLAGEITAAATKAAATINKKTSTAAGLTLAPPSSNNSSTPAPVI